MCNILEINTWVDNNERKNLFQPERVEEREREQKDKELDTYDLAEAK